MTGKADTDNVDATLFALRRGQKSSCTESLGLAEAQENIRRRLREDGG